MSLVRLTMPAGVIVEVPADRIVQLWAPTLEHRAHGVECVAQLADGSLIGCVETPAALLKGGVRPGIEHRVAENSERDAGDDGSLETDRAT